MENFGKLFRVVVAALSLGIAGEVHANPNGTPDVLSYGQINYLNANPVGVYEQFGSPLGFNGASILIASMASPFSGVTPLGQVFSGILTSNVYVDSHNPLNGLDFTYQFTNDLPGVSTGPGITQMAISGFASVFTDVGFIRLPTDQTHPGQNLPTSVDRSAFLVDAGNVIDWNFLSSSQCSQTSGCFSTPGLVAPGQTTAQLIVYTSATSFSAFGTALFTDPGNGSAATFAPTIPEPDTYAMVLAGLGLTGFMTRRRRKQ